MSKCSARHTLAHILILTINQMQTPSLPGGCAPAGLNFCSAFAWILSLAGWVADSTMAKAPSSSLQPLELLSVRLLHGGHPAAISRHHAGCPCPQPGRRLQAGPRAGRFQSNLSAAQKWGYRRLAEQMLDLRKLGAPGSPACCRPADQRWRRGLLPAPCGSLVLRPPHTWTAPCPETSALVSDPNQPARLGTSSPYGSCLA